MKKLTLHLIFLLISMASIGQENSDYLYGVDPIEKIFFKLYLPTAISSGYADSAIVSIYNLPGSSNNLDGIAFDGQYLWHGDNYENKIFKIDPSNGDVVASFYTPNHTGPDNSDDRSPYGLAYVNNTLLMVDNGNGVNKLYQIDINNAVNDGNCNNAVINEIDIIQNPYGIAYDGVNIWLSSRDGRLVYVDFENAIADHTVTGNILKDFNDGYDRGIAWDGNNIIHADLSNGTIARIDTSDGSIVSEFITPFNGSRVSGLSVANFGNYTTLSGILTIDYLNCFICSIENKIAELSFDISDYENVDNITLEFGYINFDWIVNEYPIGVTKEVSNFQILIDNQPILTKNNITNTTTLKEKIDITNIVGNNQNFNIQFKYIGGGDAVEFVYPKIVIHHSQISNSVTETTSSKFPYFEVYPNPAHDKVTLKCNVAKFETFQIQFCNSNGQTLINILEKKNYADKYEKVIDISPFPPGNYFFSLINKNRIIKTIKFVKN